MGRDVHQHPHGRHSPGPAPVLLPEHRDRQVVRGQSDAGPLDLAATRAEVALALVPAPRLFVGDDERASGVGPVAELRVHDPPQPERGESTGTLVELAPDRDRRAHDGEEDVVDVLGEPVLTGDVLLLPPMGPPGTPFQKVGHAGAGSSRGVDRVRLDAVDIDEPLAPQHQSVVAHVMPPSVRLDVVRIGQHV